MNSSNANEHSTWAGNAGDASPRRSTPPSTPQDPDKKNLPNPKRDHPKFQPPSNSNQHSVLDEMNTHHNSPSHAQNQWASGSKGSSRDTGRLSGGQVTSDLQPPNANQLKSPRKRSAEMAEMDDSPLPLKRSRREVPFQYMKDIEASDENLEMIHLIFLDILDAQDKKEIYLHKPEDIPTIVPSIDDRELFENSSAPDPGAHRSRLEEIMGTSDESGTRERTLLSLLREYGLVTSCFDGLWDVGDKQTEKKVAEGSSQESGDHTTTYFGDISREENRADAVKATTNYKTNGSLLSPAPLPIIEWASFSEAESNFDLTLVPGGSNSGSRTVTVSPSTVQVPAETVPGGSKLPKAKKTNPTGEMERNAAQMSAKARSDGIVGTGVAGPSNTASSTPFAYTEARAQEIWERADAKDYLGAHALFDPREQVVIIDGKTKVREYLDDHPELEDRLREPNSGRPRECLYICGASAIWKRKESTTESTAGAKPNYELQYQQCHDCGYASMDNYKKHIYRHHLNKFYKQYSKKGKGRA